VWSGATWSDASGMRCVVSVDVGTTSARAGLFSADTGALLARAERPFSTRHDSEDFYEQSSSEIWLACVGAVRAVAGAGGGEAVVVGLSFDATCSLVALDKDDAPVNVSKGGGDEYNVIVWMDHRAKEETALINSTGVDALQYVGGVMSPEMQPPKLLWLKTHMADSWSRTAKFFDLADFLVYRATGKDVRSTCTLICKWGGYAREGWDQRFFAAIGLPELLSSGRCGQTGCWGSCLLSPFCSLPLAVVDPGAFVGEMSASCAEQMGLGRFPTYCSCRLD
jgi:D-ribulokinase